MTWRPMLHGNHLPTAGSRAVREHWIHQGIHSGLQDAKRGLNKHCCRSSGHSHTGQKPKSELEIGVLSVTTRANNKPAIEALVPKRTMRKSPREPAGLFSVNNTRFLNTSTRTE